MAKKVGLVLISTKAFFTGVGGTACRKSMASSSREYLWPHFLLHYYRTCKHSFLWKCQSVGNINNCVVFPLTWNSNLKIVCVRNKRATLILFCQIDCIASLAHSCYFLFIAIRVERILVFFHYLIFLTNIWRKKSMKNVTRCGLLLKK